MRTIKKLKNHKYLNFIVTRSGRKFDLKKPRPIDVDIDDIAIALARVCRFTGHTKDFLSVGQHCVNVARILEEWGAPIYVRLYGLLHDAPEAYLNDVVRPLKKMLPQYKKLEGNVMKAILKGLKLDKHLCLTRSELELVKRADEACALAERRDQILHNGTLPRHFVASDAEAWGKKIVGMEWKEAEFRFRDEFRFLCERL